MDASTIFQILPSIIPFPKSFLSSDDIFARRIFNDNFKKIYQERIVPIIALAHHSGWSAELIANTVTEHCGSQITPEMVWDAYKKWEAVWEEKKLAANYFNEIGKEFQSLLQVLPEYGCPPNYEARPLSKTPRPVSAKHCISWRPNVSRDIPMSQDRLHLNDSSQKLSPKVAEIGNLLTEIQPFIPITDDDTDERRMDTIDRLSSSTDPKVMTKPAPSELAVLEKLGEDVQEIIETLLPFWVEHMDKVVPEMAFTRKIAHLPGETSKVDFYVELFRSRWEVEFGKMADGGPGSIAYVDGKPSIRIASTGAAAQWYFCRMLLNRLFAMDSRREWSRRETGYVEVAPKDLPEDVTDCLICLQRLGVPGPDGKTEMPVRVTACCGNYFGVRCLREWYGEFGNERCPICRQTMSPNFVEQLCGHVDDRIFSRE